jgi:hypothetical protein
MAAAVKICFQSGAIRRPEIAAIHNDNPKSLNMYRTEHDETPSAGRRSRERSEN